MESYLVPLSFWAANLESAKVHCFYKPYLNFKIKKYSISPDKKANLKLNFVPNVPLSLTQTATSSPKLTSKTSFNKLKLFNPTSLSPTPFKPFIPNLSKALPVPYLKYVKPPLNLSNSQKLLIPQWSSLDT